MLREYAKHVKPEDDEFKDVEHAMRIVSNVVDHIDHELDMAKRSLALNELLNRIILTKAIKVIKPGRFIIRQGYLDKISRKEVHVRYFVLFNDSLFYLTPVMNEMYKLKEELPLFGMQVEHGSYEMEFNVRSCKRSFALLARTEEERDEWCRDLTKAIADFTEKQNSFFRRQSFISSESTDNNQSLIETDSSLSLTAFHTDGDSNQRASILSAESSIGDLSTNSYLQSRPRKLGELAPIWVFDSRVTMCQACAVGFNVFIRRHHCRACGHIFCYDCSSYKYPLKFSDNKPQRVCLKCFEELTKQEEFKSTSVSSPVSQRNSPNEKDKRLEHLEDSDSIDNSDSQQNNINNNDNNPIIKVSSSISPQNSIKSTSSNGSAHPNLLSRKSRSNSCHELRHNQVKPSTNSSTIAEANHLTSLSRNLNIRSSSRAKSRIFSSVLCEVSASDPDCLISGWLQRYTEKKTWKRYWCVIKNMVLYSFKASEDVRAVQTLPLPGYNVSIAEECIKGHEAELTIKLYHESTKSTIFFYAENEQDLKRWFMCFKDSSLMQST